MVKINGNYANVKKSYLFSEIASRVSAFIKANPSADVIKMGIGDVTLPLIPEVVDAMKKAADEMGVRETFRGYGPEQGYAFVREAVKGYFSSYGVEIDIDEIFIGDGAKSDVANITDIFSNENVIIVPDPVYPVYFDTNVMCGRRVEFMKGTMSNGFLPMPCDCPKGDIVYLCSPNNPTGAAYDYAQLKAWVDYANANNMIILYDSAYEAFVSDKLPRSIFEIEGAKTCAIEFNSLSKTAGFTGTRCGYTIVPKALIIDGESLNAMWNRRQSTKFNGVSYVVQRGAEAVFASDNMRKIRANIDYYRENARIISETMTKLGIRFTGGKNSPYIWLECPNGMKSWDFFDMLLSKANVVGTPGCGFGECGEGFFRLTAFNTKEKTIEAMARIEKILTK